MSMSMKARKGGGGYASGDAEVARESYRGCLDVIRGGWGADQTGREPRYMSTEVQVAQAHDQDSVIAQSNSTSTIARAMYVGGRHAAYPVT
jgi:hypothetical protein